MILYEDSTLSLCFRIKRLPERSYPFLFNPFHVAGLFFLYPMETPENKRLANTFRGYRPVAWNELMYSGTSYFSSKCTKKKLATYSTLPLSSLAVHKGMVMVLWLGFTFGSGVTLSGSGGPSLNEENLIHFPKKYSSSYF